MYNYNSIKAGRGAHFLTSPVVPPLTVAPPGKSLYAPRSAGK